MPDDAIAKHRVLIGLNIVFQSRQLLAKQRTWGCKGMADTCVPMSWILNFPRI